MAKYRFLIDPNTFFDDSGTSKILSNSGPVTLPIPVNLLLKIQEKYGNILRKYGFWKSENLKISKFSEVLCTEPQVFLLRSFRSLFCFFVVWFCNMVIWWNDEKNEDEECPDINFPLIKCTKAWIWISFLPKNMNPFWAKTNQLFYFWAR